MGYYTVNFDDKEAGNDLLTEYLLHKQSVELERSFESESEKLAELTTLKDKKCKEDRKEIMELHCGELAKKLIGIIKTVIGEYDSEGGMTDADKLKKSIVTEIVDKVIEAAKLEMEEIEEIISEKSSYPFGRYYILRQLIEILLFAVWF